MFRKLFIPFLAVLLLLPTLGNTAANHVNLLNDTVRPFQWNSTDETTGQTTLNTHCSVFSVNPKNHGWMTAAHCIQDPETGVPYTDTYFIDGHTARIVEVDVEHDLALVQTPDWTDPVGLKLALRGPIQGDTIEALGYAWGQARSFYFVGIVAQTEFNLFGFFGSMAGMPAIGGMSGCPLVDHDGRVVGVTHVGFDGGFGSSASPVLGLTAYSVLRSYDRGWVFSR
jgi:S1-C subfamily serine protease